MRFTSLILLFFFSIFFSNAQIYTSQNIADKGIVYIEEPNVGGLFEMPIVVPFKPIQSVKIEHSLNYSNEILASTKAKDVLFIDEYAAIELNTVDKTIKYLPPSYSINIKCYQAIDRAPDWLEMDLLRQFRKLSKYYLDDDFADLILKAPENVVDEVAFQIANLSMETLRDTRFRASMYLLENNAKFIYLSADSLKYVKLVEYGDFASGNYYTTAKYRIKNGSDTIWSEIPKEIYYWYLVMPKIDREGVYEQDLTSSSQFRTYGYFWRNYLWLNPNKNYNYTIVNITTSKGSIDTIQRLGALLKIPTVLWDRNLTYFPFKRSFDNKDNALDVIGNWASRAIPIDAKANRPFEPNQCIYEHDGNCHEDAILVAAAARTALIPIIHLNTAGEDHAFGAIYDNNQWYHYEFFRGGFSDAINPSFAGITNMMKGGSYGWTTSVVQGSRPDGYRINHTEEYTSKLCTLNFTVSDKNGLAVDGAKIIVWCSPGPYSSGWVSKIGFWWTDHTGKLKITVGAGKKYAFQVYHPKFGYLPDATNAYIINSTNTLNGQSYNASASFTDKIMPALPMGKLHTLPSSSNYGTHINFITKNIIAGVNDEDVQKSQFSYRNEEDGSISFFLLDEQNYLKFKNKDTFDYYYPVKYFNSGNLFLPLPKEGKWYIIFSNQEATINLQEIAINADLIENAVYQSQNNIIQGNNALVFPTFFTEKCTLQSPDWATAIEIFDMLGNKVEVLCQNENNWTPAETLQSGMYFIVFRGDSKTQTEKIIYRK